ncbi:hypothetical protein CHARACLAT_032335 [Characodon lateralis]|uniref:Uncharacterized protein n=1 Tax=Characodon lateralis TaxID=208331 RepID=A0ABU7D2J3_9TELE|nr:hypothetical protein [Characodon lateralis]
MASEKNSDMYSFVSFYTTGITEIFAHKSHYSHLLENDVIKQQNIKFAYFCIFMILYSFHTYFITLSLLSSKLAASTWLSFCLHGGVRELIDGVNLQVLNLRESSS